MGPGALQFARQTRQRAIIATPQAVVPGGVKWSEGDTPHTFKYEEEKVILDTYTLVDASRTRTVYNWPQYFSPEALERGFVECGFTVDKLHSDVAGSPFDPEGAEIAVVAKRS